MVNRGLLIALSAALAIAAPKAVVAGQSQANAEGELQIDVRFLPGFPPPIQFATGDLCLSALADSVTGGAADFSGHVNGAANPGALCTTVIDFGKLGGAWPGLGILNVPKFPAPVAADGDLNVIVNGTNSDANGAWMSIGPLAGIQTVKQFSNSSVDRVDHQAPAGLAVSNLEDPWVFIAAQMTKIEVKVTLNSAMLSASANAPDTSAAHVEAFANMDFTGPNGSGTADSQGFNMDVSNNDTFTLSDPKLLFDDVFTLQQNETWTLTSGIRTAANGTPEPNAATFLGGMAAFGAIVTLRRRLRARRRR